MLLHRAAAITPSSVLAAHTETLREEKMRLTCYIPLKGQLQSIYVCMYMNIYKVDTSGIRNTISYYFPIFLLYIIQQLFNFVNVIVSGIDV